MWLLVPFIPWEVWVELSGGLCRTGTSAGCPFGRGSRSTAASQRPHHQKMESEGHADTVIPRILQTHAFHLRERPPQTLVIWSASGRTVGVTLSSILTCSRTSSGILFNNAELMVLSCAQTQKKTQIGAQRRAQQPPRLGGGARRSDSPGPTAC